MGNTPVYLDWAATAPLCEEAAAACAPYMVPGPENLAVGGNANSLHSCGRAAFAALEDARAQILAALHARRPDEIVFTGGATEADNTALIGIAGALAPGAQKVPGTAPGAGFTLITSSIEHDAVLVPARLLERGGCSVVYLPPDRAGFISPESLQGALAHIPDPASALVSLCALNNEIGSVQPVAELAACAHSYGALFHTDATQALGKIPVDLCAWDTDAASFSAHKVAGPKGIGALYLKTGTPFVPCAVGGGQESGMRSGTQNVAGAVGFAAACRAAADAQASESRRLRALRDRLIFGLSSFSEVVFSVDVAPGDQGHSCHIVHFCVRGFESGTLILRLDMKGFAVSGGSACSSHSLEPSHVMRALGIPSDLAQGALRVSLGRYTQESDIDAFLAAFALCLKGA